MSDATTVTHMLYGSDKDFAEGASTIRALLFGQMVLRAVAVTQSYLPDLYHDALWIEQNVNGPTEFYFMVREHGTNIGESALVAERIATTEPRVLYHVALTVRRGMWSGNFTPLVTVPPRNYWPPRLYETKPPAAQINGGVA